MADQLPLAAQCDQRGDDDQAAVALFQARALPDLAEQPFFAVIDQVGHDIADGFARRVDLRLGHGFLRISGGELRRRHRSTAAPFGNPRLGRSSYTASGFCPITRRLRLMSRRYSMPSAAIASPTIASPSASSNSVSSQAAYTWIVRSVMMPALNSVLTSTRKMLVPSRMARLRPPENASRTASRTTVGSTPTCS